MKPVPLIVAAGLVLCVLGAVLDPADLARAWLVVALIGLGFPLGALMILMLDNLTGGRWGEAMRPLLLAMSATLPLALLAFLPLFVALPQLFPWIADPGHLSLTAQQKLAYLTPTGIGVRFLACAIAWLGIAAWLGVWTGGRPRFGTPALASGISIALHAVLFTIFATDWMQSLEPDFYSTIYPMLVAAEEVVMALAAIMLLIPRPSTRPGGEATSTLAEDLGKLLISAVFFWGYLAFMQWLVIWSGNLPDEIGWYLVRFNGGWQAVLWAIVLVAFAVPFVGLVGRRGKRDPRWLTAVVTAALLGQVLEGVWRIAPAFRPSPLLLGLLLPAALLLGGLGLLAMQWLVTRLPKPEKTGEAHAAAH